MSTDQNTERTGPVVLCILDGWGHREDPTDNAIALANAPNWRALCGSCPQSLIQTSGLSVGLPDGQMGNSEVGHMNIGAGRVVMQDLPRIDAAIADGSLLRDPRLKALAANCPTVHILGLLSPGGVHAHQDHVVALAQALVDGGAKVLVHALLDGRDTPPKSAADYLGAVDRALPAGARIATLIGRYWAMDRDQRWDRVEIACNAMVDGVASPFPDWKSALADAYQAGETDEFVKPRRLADFEGMADGDGLVMANFRADRAREILTALLDPQFDGFHRDRTLRLGGAIGMTEYSDALNPFMQALFPSENLPDTLGEVVSRAGRTQLRISETEKYAHVTFFLNGGREQQYAGEDRILIPSPDVATYDLQPEMSATEVTDRLVARIGDGKTDLIVVNFANPDMVGHTGDLGAAIRAVETSDTCLGRLDTAIREANGTLLITADHGNLEMMSDPETGQPHTAHTTNPVPLTMVNGPQGMGLQPGCLADLAPTILRLMGLPQPAAMTGKCLLTPASAMDAGHRVAS